MKRWGWGLFLAVASCAPPPGPALQQPRPRISLAPDESRSPWPDVLAPVVAQGDHERDAALVVAIGRYPSLPAIAGAHTAGTDWVRFLTTRLGLPASRVTSLHDAEATKAGVFSALGRTAAQVEPGGRLWFVFVGHGARELVPADGGDGTQPFMRLQVSALVNAAAQAPGQPFFVLDTGFDRTLVGPLWTGIDESRPEPIAQASVVIEGRLSGVLPGTSRPALSYFLLGALRGWGDGNHDGLVTAREAFEFTRDALHTAHAGRPGSLPVLHATVECQRLTTLSASREKAPDLAALLSPPAPPPPFAPARDIEAAARAVHAANAKLKDAYARYAQTNGIEGAKDRIPLFFHDGRELHAWLHGPDIPYPDVVARAVEARVHYARLLGGAANAQAASLLIEAARLMMAHRRLDGIAELVQPVLEARCGLDSSGSAARGLLSGLALFAQAYSRMQELDALECDQDQHHHPGQEEDRALPPVLREARRHYAVADDATDPSVARCEWTEAAAKYEAALHLPTDHGPDSEAALNGAHAYRQIGHPAVAAKIYDAFIRAHARPIPGEDKDRHEPRRRWAMFACKVYFDLAKSTPEFVPSYSALCLGQDWMTCEEGDVSKCNGVCPRRWSSCEIWADHAEAGIGVAQDPKGALRVRKALCADNHTTACMKLAAKPSP